MDEELTIPREPRSRQSMRNTEAIERTVPSEREPGSAGKTAPRIAAKRWAMPATIALFVVAGIALYVNRNSWKVRASVASADLAAAESRLARTEDDLQSANLQNAVYREQSSRITATQQADQAREDALREKGVALGRRVEELGAEVDRLEHELATSGDAARASATEVGRLERELKAAHSERARFATSNAELERELSSLRAKLHDGARNHGTDSARLAKFELDNAEYEKRIQELEARSRELDARNEKLTKMVEVARKAGVSFPDEPKTPPSGQSGEVVQVTSDQSIIIVKLANAAGLAVGTKLSVFRGKEFIATIRAQRASTGELLGCQLVTAASGKAIKNGDVVRIDEN